MRPIDADAMLKRLEEWNTDDRIDKALYNFTFNRIMEQPTIEERKTGEWTIEDCHAATYKYCCSACGAHHRARYDFCPSCGAKMEGNT